MVLRSLNMQKSTNRFRVHFFITDTSNLLPSSPINMGVISTCELISLKHSDTILQTLFEHTNFNVETVPHRIKCKVFGTKYPVMYFLMTLIEDENLDAMFQHVHYSATFDKQLMSPFLTTLYLRPDIAMQISIKSNLVTLRCTLVITMKIQ